MNYIASCCKENIATCSPPPPPVVSCSGHVCFKRLGLGITAEIAHLHSNEETGSAKCF